MIRLFKKKAETTNDIIKEMQCDFASIRIDWESMKRKYEELEQSIPSIARQELLTLARQKAITAVTMYRDTEFLTEVYADRVKELKRKKQMLDQAIIDCNKALAEIEGGEE